jgi:IS605 OrfB family transposase
VLLESTDTQSIALSDTTSTFTSAFNQAVDIGWQANVGNATKLHYLAYYPVKAAHPSLVSDLINQARVKAAEALRSAFELRKDHRRTVSQPKSQSCPPRYNKNTYRVDWQARIVRLSTTNGRQTIRFRVPEFAEKYAGFPVDTADLCYKNGSWWLHIVVTVPPPEITPSGVVVGVDLGLAQPAVASTPAFLGEPSWKNIEGKTFKLKRQLQKKGTRSAKRHLRRLNGKQDRFRKNCDHVLSKQIVQSCAPGSTIVVENLTDIRGRIKTKKKTKISRRVHSWTFAQVRSFIEYKAEERGCTVVAVDPRHTSQTCSRCGHQARNNRRSRSRFVCQSCGFELHADLNAARNIAAKYHASLGISETSGLTVNQPIVSGRAAIPHDSGASILLKQEAIDCLLQISEGE